MDLSRGNDGDDTLADGRGDPAAPPISAGSAGWLDAVAPVGFSADMARYSRSARDNKKGR